MAITNNMGIWGADGDYGNWPSSVRPDTNGRIAGFIGDRFVYANQVNYALKCSSLLPYVFSSILESSSISSSYNFDINPADITNSNISTFKTNMTNAINSYIASITVVNATNANYATKIGTSSAHPAIGSSTIPVYINSDGVITQASTYAGGTKVTLNNANKGANTASFYAPTTAGTAGEILYSNGSGNAPGWLSSGTAGQFLQTQGSGNLPQWTAIFAPTTIGTTGQFLKSNGNETDKTPTWETIYVPKIPGVSGQLLISKGSATDKTPTWLPAGDDGQILKSNGSGFLPSWTNLPKTLYKHQITLTAQDMFSGNIVMEIIDDKSTTYDLASLKTYVASQVEGPTGTPTVFPPARGWSKMSAGTSDKFPVIGVYYHSTLDKLYSVVFNGTDIAYSSLEINSVNTYYQKVTQLT